MAKKQQVKEHKLYICSSVEYRSKGCKVAIFHEIINEKVIKDHDLTLYFNNGDPCNYEVLSRYNLLMNEI